MDTMAKLYGPLVNTVNPEIVRGGGRHTVENRDDISVSQKCTTSRCWTGKGTHQNRGRIDPGAITVDVRL